MLNLVWKDIAAARRILLIVLPLGILQLAVFASVGPFILPAALFFSAILASGSIALEETQRTELLWNSLPVSRGQVVFGRYLTVLLGILVGLGLSWAVGQVVGRLLAAGGGAINTASGSTGTVDPAPFASPIALAPIFVVLALSAALYLPFYFRWGAGRGAVILSAVGVGTMLIITLLFQWLLQENGYSSPMLQPGAWRDADPAARAEFEAQLRVAIPWVLSSSVAGSLVLFALSSVASWCLYETRDL
jgi:ABC-type transport system involved in multi-copper enzyme maturation permease subunit